MISKGYLSLFPGTAGDTAFALAHNGVLTNDKLLRRELNLPATRIETDSYVAVQLIEQGKALDLNSIQFMAEQVKGTFNFTILDRDDLLYIIKGNNPLCLYHYKKEGFFLYASTQQILDDAVEKMGFAKLHHEEIGIADGEILMINTDGTITRSHFTPPVSQRCSCLYSFTEPKDNTSDEYRRFMMDYAATLGIPRRELEWLHAWGFPDAELEECVFDHGYRTLCLSDTGYYDEMEDTNEFDDFESLLWG